MPEVQTTKKPSTFRAKTVHQDQDTPEKGPQSHIERLAPPVRTALVCPDLRGSETRRPIDVRLAEFEGLARAIPTEKVFSKTFKLRAARPATFFGLGQVEEIAELIKNGDVELLLVDTQLSPVQQRNLERETGTKVLDRTGLILEIFGARASTREGVLQVELAHLNYQKSRLVRSWTHLERQRGGGGFLGGPGETQIESDRRHLQERINMLEKRIEKVRRTRAEQRKTRSDTPFPMVALVGYTNSGKSTLFNRLTNADVMAENLLFATLDTTVRRLELPHGRTVMLSDTVGFISDLPTDLVAAFRATLEEAMLADVILHVRDIANPDHKAQAQDVLDVLDQLGLAYGADIPVIEVWNKLDLAKAAKAEPDGTDGAGRLERAPEPVGSVFATVPVSAKTGEGVATLLTKIEEALSSQAQTFHLLLPHSASEGLGWLYANTEVMERADPDEVGTVLTVRVGTAKIPNFLSRFRTYLSSAPSD